MSQLTGLKVAVLRGTGPQGRGLALRFARAGLDVVVGSRAVDLAAKVAAELGDRSGGQVAGADNADAAGAADVDSAPWTR